MIACVAATQLAVVGWIMANWHPAKRVEAWVDLSQVPAAHFGWGVLPSGPVADVGLLVGVLGALLLAGRVLTRRERCGPVEWCVVAGLALIVLGVVPFVRYFYAPLGAGDRFNVVSALGGALIWAAVVDVAHRHRRPIGLGALAALLGFGLVARADRVQLWSAAAADARAMQAAAVDQVPDPTGEVVVGPPAVQVDNVAAFLDRSNVQPALQLAYDDERVTARMAVDDADLAEADPASRVDATDGLTLDDVCNPVARFLGSCVDRSCRLSRRRRSSPRRSETGDASGNLWGWCNVLLPARSPTRPAPTSSRTPTAG